MIAAMRRVTVSRALPHHEWCSDVYGPVGPGRTGLDRIIMICDPARVTIKRDATRFCQAVFTPNGRAKQENQTLIISSLRRHGFVIRHRYNTP